VTCDIDEARRIAGYTPLVDAVEARLSGQKVWTWNWKMTCG
jgi:hypothetical protein